ncbi:acetylornithine deacetylase [Halothiobacillus sp. DCM-1]|uniref:acetylornithine deacetylase n=1 Tax=Halothiobacillus sp. DCM-1 TaxID=3112558 RepID=UPI003251D6D4
MEFPPVSVTPMAAPDLTTMLAQLIATPSISSVSPQFDQGNRAVIDQLAEWLAAAGFRVEILPLAHRPDKANLIARLGAETGDCASGLILAGHTDTVPFDEGRWRHDPFRWTIDGDRAYGLGTADMKSFLALAIEAARGLRPADLTAPLWIVATADEESSMDGARLLAELQRPKARFCVIGEPTGLAPVALHKGVMMEAVTVIGRSGHSSDPANGVNALDGMQRVLTAITDWRESLKTITQPRFAVPYPTLNFGHICGGDNPNRICPSCTLHFDLRPLPGMRGSELRAALRERVAEALADTGCSFELRTLSAGIEPFDAGPDSVLAGYLAEISGQQPRSVAYGTEAPFYQALGCDTVVFGPGSIDQAHQPDEFIRLDALHDTVRMLRQLIQRCCLAG